MVIKHAVTRSRAWAPERPRLLLYIRCAYVLRYIYDPDPLQRVRRCHCPWTVCCNSNASLIYRDRPAVLASPMVRSRRVSCAHPRLCAVYRPCLDGSTRLYAALPTPRPPSDSLDLGYASFTSRIL